MCFYLCSSHDSFHLIILGSFISNPFISVISVPQEPSFILDRNVLDILSSYFISISTIVFFDEISVSMHFLPIKQQIKDN